MSMKNEWKHYIFDETKDYTFEEAIEKALEAFNYLVAHKIRVNIDMIIDKGSFEKEHHMSEEQKRKYVKNFACKGYTLDSCTKIINCMDVIYHMFNISISDAELIADYAAQNKYTLTKALKDKLYVDLDEVSEFIDNVFGNIATYFMLKTLQSGMELIELLKDAYNDWSSKRDLD